MKRRLSLGVVCAFVVVGCTPGTDTTTGTELATTTVETAAPEQSTTSFVAETTLPAGTEELSQGLREEIARLIPLTEELRELTFVAPPTVAVLSSEELAARVIEQLETDYEEAEADEALYKLLGLVEPEFDLLGTLKALYGEQVAGYYDGDTEELVVTARRDDFSPLEEATLVHELTHALTDQVLAFNTRYDALFDNNQFDQGSAFQAVIEGDATLVETLFAQQLTPAEQQQFLEEAFAVDSTIFDQVPDFMQDSLLFPYNAGATFVQSVWQEGGFPALDAVYADPPASTEQIITPSDYGTDQPVEVDVADQALAGYELAYGSRWGELGFRLMFDQVLGGFDRAAEGWGGDSYDLYFNGTDALLVLVYQGDTESDGADMSDALGDYLAVITGNSEPVVDGSSRLYEGDDYFFVSRRAGQVLLLAAGDPVVGATARDWLPGF
ncbi:MAG: DUF6782 family putative metallopeptidase [Actinomycetota bacterium]